MSEEFVETSERKRREKSGETVQIQRLTRQEILWHKEKHHRG